MVSVGPRALQDVPATVVIGSADIPVLLGMTFLENFELEMQDDDAVLFLGIDFDMHGAFVVFAEDELAGVEVVLTHVT